MTLLAVAAIAGIATPILQNSIHPYLLASRELNLTAIDVKLPAKQAQFRETMRIFVAVFESTPLHRLARGFIPAAVGLFLRLVELIVVSCVIELAMTFTALRSSRFQSISSFCLCLRFLCRSPS
jgi:competence protein ComEC